jgi:hypothetical protein
VVTDRVVSVDLPGFITNPPERLQDLLPLYDASKGLDQQPGFQGSQPVPSGWDNRRNRVPAGSKVKQTASGMVECHDYDWGKPRAWNVALYHQYFKSVKSNADIPDSARRLSEAFGGWFAGVPLALFIE